MKQVHKKKLVRRAILDENFHLDIDEYSTICLYLGLPIDISTLLDTDGQSGLNNLINDWISAASNRKIQIKYPTTINQLYRLPDEYIDLMNQIATG